MGGSLGGGGGGGGGGRGANCMLPPPSQIIGGPILICINFHSYSPSSFHMNFGSKSPKCFCEKQVLTLKSE